MNNTRYLLLPATLGLPLVLLFYALLTSRELNEMKAVYLRDRAATIAARLETLPPEELRGSLPERLANEEPALVDVEVFDTPSETGGNSALEAIWRGRELFRIEETTAGGQKVFRAYIPFHSESRLHVARIDLADAATDFLLAHARHNLLVAVVAGFALLLLSLYALWSARRTAILEKRQLELEHLAHLGKMSAILAHELRNPLGTIKGFAQLACEKADARVAALLSPILGEIRRLEKLATDLLLYGRPREPVLRPAEWPVLAKQLQAHARAAMGEKAIRFEWADQPLRFETDSDLLHEALLNLVRNSVEAVDATQDAEVRLSIEQTSGGLMIAIQDNGPGIAEEVRARLFEPFVTTKASGTGLGLSIARKLVRSLGGELRLVAAQPRGTRAELMFPRLRAETLTTETTRHGTYSDY
jgi:signal transduction histidine kinase